MKKLVITVLTVAIGLSIFAACGGAAKFEKTYEGKYYTFEHPADFTVEEKGEGIVLKNDKLEINLQSIPTPGSKYGDLASTQSIAEQIKKEESNNKGMKATIEEIDLNGSKALWVEGEMKEENQAAAMVIVPLDGAMVMFGLLQEVEMGKEVELAKDIVKTLKITKPEFFATQENEEKEKEESQEDKTEDKSEGEIVGTVTGEWIESDSFKVINPGGGWQVTNESGFVMFNKGLEAINILGMPLSGLSMESYINGAKQGLKDFGNIEETKVKYGENEYEKLSYVIGTIKTNLLITGKGQTVVQVTVSGEISPDAENILKSLVIK